MVGVLAAFVLIVVLRLRRVDFSLAMLIASAVIAATSPMPLDVLVGAALRTASDPRTFNLGAAVVLIAILGYSLKETGLMVELIDGLKGVLPRRVLLAIIPSMFGLLSMLGGALMSAPFNEPEADRLGLRPEHKTYINVWFRHLWYWASPISPVPILAASLAGYGLMEFLAVQLPLFPLVLLIGFAVSATFIRGSGGEDGVDRGYRKVVRGLAPIVLTITLSVVGVPVWAAVSVGIAIVFALSSVPLGKALRMAYSGVRWDIAAAVVSMLFFRNVILLAGSVNELFKGLVGLGVPLIVVVVAAPLLVGSISGTPTMGIGIIFSLLLPLLGITDVHLVSVVYAGVVCGYLASPMHLCLILSNSYYRSDLGKVYRYLVPSAAALYAANLLYHLILSNGLASP